jgi:hypothetical protein
MCLLMRDDPPRYERAAVRWTGRFALEAREVSIEAVEDALAAFDALPERPDDAMEHLATLCFTHNVRP